MAKPVGILGGTFDPVHIGHLRLALESVDALDLAEVMLVPLHTPPHREPVRTDPEERLHMLRLAVEGIDTLKASDLEVARGGISFTIDTVRDLRRGAGGRPLCLIMGLDAFEKLDTWKQWELILDFVHIIVADRPGTGTGVQNPVIERLYADRRVNAGEIHQSAAGGIIRIEIPPLSVSSTRIRRLLISGGNPEFLVPEKVLSYIRKQRPYRR